MNKEEMKHTIIVRTLLGQAIDTFEEYIKTKGNLQTDYSLEKYMQEILDYIDYLEKENKKQKEVIYKAIEYVKRNIYSYYDSKGEKYIEETVFERKANPKKLLDILKEVSE